MDLAPLRHGEREDLEEFFLIMMDIKKEVEEVEKNEETEKTR